MLVSGYWMFKGNYLFNPASSIQYPASAHSDINLLFENFVLFGSDFQGIILILNKPFPGTLSRKAHKKIPQAIKTAGF
jgi:hypothetical protein